MKTMAECDKCVANKLKGHLKMDDMSFAVKVVGWALRIEYIKII